MPAEAVEADAGAVAGEADDKIQLWQNYLVSFYII